MKWWEMIINKVFSARFIITVFIGLTYCKMVHHCVYFYLQSMKNNPEKMEAFVTGLIMGFSSLAMFVIKSYFDRIDRPSAPDTTTSSVTTPAPGTQTTEQVALVERQKPNQNVG